MESEECAVWGAYPTIELGSMRRILVCGLSGAGKSTLSRALAERLGLRYVELDALFHKPNWVDAPDEEFIPAVQAAIEGDGWVVDGNYRKVRDIVWDKADTFIWLDYSLPRILYRCTLRTTLRCLRREVLWSGCRERFWAQFLTRDGLIIYTLRTRAERHRVFSEMIQKAEFEQKAAFHFRRPRAAEEWLASI